MNSTKKGVTVILVFALLMISGCATIVGGSNYNAHILVNGGEKAKISREGLVVGYGNAYLKVKRSTANRFEFTVEQDGCEPETFKFTARKFRGWAFFGTLVGWTGYVTGVYIPWGVAVDLATGALWKPDDTEAGIVKVDAKNYVYHVKYLGCTEHKEEETNNGQ